MRRFFGILGAAVVLTGTVLVAPPAHAASPVPGRYCKTADAGKVVNTARYGKVKCAKKGGRYRWVDIPG